MNYSCVFFGLIFIAAGILFACGKVHIHLAAWKQMPESEKEKIRIRPLCLNIGEIIMLNGVIFLLKGLLVGFTSNWFTIAMVAWMVVAGFDAWYISKSNKFVLK